MRRTMILLLGLLALLAHPLALSQEARRRWEMERQIRLDKFEQVLPGAMRDAGIDLWIVAMRENAPDPLWNDLGRVWLTDKPSALSPYPIQPTGGQP